MIRSLVSALLLSASLVAAQDFTDLVGTWSSKSNSTFTGSGFYDPANDQFTEPKHTGISYSFDANGNYEESYYRAVANPNRPDCPRGILQWQHGSFTKAANGSLLMTPIAVDGRQLYSDPCVYKNSIYTRYNQSEMMQRYEVFIDPYYNIKRLNLYKFDGSPIMPLYLAYNPPQMLPTTTLNPVVTPTPSAKSNSKVKRDVLLDVGVLGKRSDEMKRADRWWWFGVLLTASGGVLYLFF